MSGPKLHGISELRDRLVLIKYVEALSWKDEDLEEVICCKSLPWFSLLKWLLERLVDNINVGDTEKNLTGIEDTAVNLGICHRTQAKNLISGKVSAKDQKKFLSHLITLVEIKNIIEVKKVDSEYARKRDQILARLPEFEVPQTRNQMKASSGAKKKAVPLSPQEPRTVESYAEDYSIMQERVEEAKKKIKRLREELGLEDGVTAQDAILQISRERKDLSDKTAMLVDSLKPLIKEAKHIHETELSSLFPVDVAEPMDLADIDSLSKKVENILQVRNDERVIESCAASLREKMLTESPKEKWSTKKVSSLPLFQLYEDSQNALID